MTSPASDPAAALRKATARMAAANQTVADAADELHAERTAAQSAADLAEPPPTVLTMTGALAGSYVKRDQ